MRIGKDTVVSIEYTLKDDAGEVLDSSVGEDPLDYLHGHGQIVPGLERALDGKDVGEKLTVDVSPADGYGERHQDRVFAVPRGQLPKKLQPKVGMQLAAEGPDGDAMPVWIIGVDDEAVTLDGNHPLAGQTLHFAIEVKSVRAATKDELEHGHAHGEDGHHH